MRRNCVLCANCPYMFNNVQMMIIKRGVGEKRTRTQTRLARFTHNTIPTTMLYKFYPLFCHPRQILKFL